jgi:hypothetical protein
MPALPWIAAAAAAVSVDGYLKGEEAAKKGREAANESRIAQAKQKSETEATKAQQQMQERRRQIREERVRRARLLQSSENTGTSGSSGEFDALGNLSTAFSVAVGESAGAKASGDRMTGYLQEGADAQFKGQQAQADMSSASSQVGLGMNLFSAAGGMSSASSIFGSSKPSSTAFVDPRDAVRGQNGY